MKTAELEATKLEKQEKFEEFYNKYCRLMKYIALKSLNNNTLAEDAVQNAFIKLLKHFDKIEEIDCHKTRTLVAIITESSCKDLIKIENRYKLRERNAFNSGLLFKENMSNINRVETQDLKDRLNELDEKYRTVLMLKTYYKFTNEEIAEVLNISKENVKKRLQRARIMALEILQERQE